MIRLLKKHVIYKKNKQNDLTVSNLKLHFKGWLFAIEDGD